MKSGAGFTLIELIIVIAIIGVLAGMIMFALNPVLQLQKARDGQRKADLRQIQSALEIYRSDIGDYPHTDLGLFNCPTSDPRTYFGKSDCTITYLKKIPTDPKNTGNYIYEYIGDGKAYNLIACLENVNDAQKDLPNNNATYCTGGTTNWSYTVSNP